MIDEVLLGQLIDAADRIAPEIEEASDHALAVMLSAGVGMVASELISDSSTPFEDGLMSELSEVVALSLMWLTILHRRRHVSEMTTERSDGDD